MRIITTASYCGTGSSAVTDFFSEFENCRSLGDYEFRFAQDPDGLSDLEYNIVENNHRTNTSQSIKHFQKMIKRLDRTWYAKEYCCFFGDDFLKLSNEYIKNITQLKTKSWWHQDQIDKGELFRFLDRLINKIYRTLKSYKSSYGKCISLLQHSEYGYFTYLTEEEFLKYTVEYTDALFQIGNKEKKPFFIVDQLVPPSNIKRYLRYFSNIKVFVVDRDPRDIYLRECVAGWGIIPTNSVEDFCKWYKITRAHRRYEEPSNDAYFLQFEDLVYDYENTTKKMMKFVGIDPVEHTAIYKYFNPQISIKNTNLKKLYPQYKKDIEYIEKTLSEYLYLFNKKQN